TPGSWAIFCTSRVSARSCTAVSGSASDVSASVSTGASAGLTLLYTGGVGGGLGGEGGAGVVARLDRLFGGAGGRARGRRQVMTLEPAELVDVICFRPGSWPNWRSSGAVTAEAMTSGLAPG